MSEPVCGCGQTWCPGALKTKCPTYPHLSGGGEAEVEKPPRRSPRCNALIGNDGERCRERTTVSFCGVLGQPEPTANVVAIRIFLCKKHRGEP